MNRDLPQLPAVRRNLTSIIRAVVAATATVSLMCVGSLPAGADELDDRKAQLRQELARQEAAVRAAGQQLSGAAKAHAEARNQLATAEAESAAADAAKAKAAELDAKRAQELKAAEVRLKQAEEAVVKAREALNAVNDRINEEIMVTTQNRDGLMNLALIFQDVNASNLSQRTQLAETLFDSSSKELDEAERRRLAFEDAEAKAKDARGEADKARQAAARQLDAKREASKAADQARSKVSALVKQRDAAEDAAAKELAAEKQREEDLKTESNAVERRIQQRIAAEKKAAAERAARERAARIKAAQAAAQAAKQKSRASQKNAARSSKASSPAKSASGGQQRSGNAPKRSSNGFIRPVSGRLSSPFGPRLHPVLGYWKLHDGTDFAASCGAPMRAAADGVVSERYYNGGYGNRLMIDHGNIRGAYVTTGYNHATRYTVRVGQRVKRGQLIGYVGSTGYSTGCHLHLMVWQNGRVVNPMARWFR